MQDFTVSPFFEILTAPNSPEAKNLYEYWRSLHRDTGTSGQETLPRRKDITLESLAALGCADRVFILEPLVDGDWQYRLLGSEIVRYFGRDVTGIPLRRHMVKEEADKAITLSNRAVAELIPIFLNVQFVSGDYSGMIETMSLPILARDDGDIWLFGGSFFTPDP